MNLTKTEQRMLDGEEGEGVRKAMEILFALGKIYDAKRLMAVKSAQVAGVSYKNLGDAGLEFLENWATKGAKVRIPTTLNPAGIDIENWKRLGIPRNSQKNRVESSRPTGGWEFSPAVPAPPILPGTFPGWANILHGASPQPLAMQIQL